MDRPGVGKIAPLATETGEERRPAGGSVGVATAVIVVEAKKLWLLCGDSAGVCGGGNGEGFCCSASNGMDLTPEGGARTTAQDIHFPRVVNSSQAAHFVCSLNSVQAGVPVGHKMPDRSAKKEQILIGCSAPCIPMFHVSARSTYCIYDRNNT